MPEINITGLQAFHFFLIAMAIPLQLLLVHWTGNSNELSRADYVER